MNEANQVMVQQPALAVSESAAIIRVIERAACNPNVDIEKMERLLIMQERIMGRNSKMAFDSAMANMQSEMPVISEKGEIKVNNVVRSKYALFEDINEAVKPIMQKHGFAISFKISHPDSQIAITGVLTHKDGHREETEIRLPSDTSGAKNSVQAIGSTVSYGKRYTMCALLNITTRGEDKDGNSELVIGPVQIKRLENLLKKCDQKANDFFVQSYGSTAQVLKTEFDELCARLEKAAGRGAQ